MDELLLAYNLVLEIPSITQVVVDNATAYKADRTKLIEKRQSLYWTPCTSHCIDLMFEKFGELP